MAPCRTKLPWKSGFSIGIPRLPRLCVVACVLSLLAPSTLGQDVPSFNPMYFTSEPSNVVAVPGSSVTLNCSVHSPLVPTIHWWKDSSPVPPNDPARTVQSNGALRIASVSPDDEGSYQCSAEVDDGNTYTNLNSRRGTVTVAKLVLQEGPSSTTAFDGNTVYFQCNFNSVPTPEISWYKNGEVLDLTEEQISARYTRMPSGGLEIREVRSSDAGTYRCRGTNPLVPPPIQSPNAVLTVTPGTNPSFQFIKAPQETESPVGQPVVLEAATNSPATFTWFKDGAEIFLVGSSAEDHYMVLGQGSLRIQQLGEIDTGLYRVLATSDADGTALDRTVKVTALVPLKFNIRPENTYTNVGSSVTLNCNAYGIPGPITSWYKEGEELQDGNVFIVSAGILTIGEVIQEDAGIYQCVADNGLENIQASAELIVLGADTGPVPSKPLNLQAADVQAQSFRLTWTEPAQLNGELQSYRIEIKGNGGLNAETIHDLGQLAKLVSDLIPETLYEVTIVAVNENGAGEPSDVLFVETLPHGEYLGSPTSVRARSEEGSCTALLVTWLAPQGDVLNYKVYYADLGAGVAQELELFTEQNFYLITGLKPFTTYGLRVVGYNANGPGTSSENLEARTAQCKPSGIPDNIAVEADSTTSITVTWEPPPPNQRNGHINGYKMKYRTVENGKRTLSLVIEGSQRTHTVSDLERGTGYEVRMAAYNNNGTGPYSDWIQVYTFDIEKNENTVPPKPADIVATSTHNKIEVSWVPPLDQTILVRGYILGYGPSIPDALRERVPGSQTQVVLTNLLPSTTYVLKLRAYNKIGEGAPLYLDVQTKQPMIGPSPTRTIHVTTRTATPSIPRELKAYVTSPYDAILTWIDNDYTPDEKPADRYYTVKYTTDYTNREMFVNSTDSSIVVTGLTPYTEYNFQVMAVSGNRRSKFSMVATNTTFDAAPSSAPRSLTVVDVENSTTALTVNWQPPRSPNGQISGYTIYYSTIESSSDSHWIQEMLPGDELTRTLHGLTADTVYYFKIRAHTSKGEGPVSAVVSHRSPVLPDTNPPVLPEATGAAPLAEAAAIGFPWWLWLVIVLAVLFIVIIAVLLLLCFVCGCCGCCADCCPSCAALCEDACACCAPFCGPFAACLAACCPCCCEDEDDCAKCWLKCCCGAAACVCCGHAYRERRKAKGSANLVGYHPVSQNGKVVGSTGPVPPDLWINHEGVEIKKLDGKKGGITVGSKAEERERLEKGGGVDQQREQVQETSFTQSSAQNQQESNLDDQAGSSNRQSQYETPTLMSATSHRSSLESDLHVGGTGSGAVHYATVDEMRRKKSNLKETARQEAVPSVTMSPPQSQTAHSPNRSEAQNRAAGATSPRYTSWGAKTNLGDRQQSSNVNYNTTNIHVEDVRNNYSASDGFSTLRDGGYQGSLGADGQAYSTLDRQASFNNNTAPGQLITYPEQNAGPQPFTITFEETTTSHSVEKSVPLPDGTSYKTSSSHQTFAKSYSTSDASQDQNLQAMLQGGLENGPLAIEIPSTSNTSLPAITAAPILRTASFNPIPQDSPSTCTQSSSFSNALGRSPPPPAPPSYNFVESASAQTQSQSSGYASANARGRASSIGASSVDSTGYRSRGTESYIGAQPPPLRMTSPIDIPSAGTSPYGSSFQNYESYRSEELDTNYGRSASNLFGGPPAVGATRPRYGSHTIDRSTGLNVDSAYGSPTSFGSGLGSYGGASTLGKTSSGGLLAPPPRPSNGYQSSVFQNSSESFRAYNGSGGGGGGGNAGTTSQFSFNNNNASANGGPSRLIEVDHAEVQTPSRFNSTSDLLQSTSASRGTAAFDLSTPTRPLRRSLSVDHEFGLANPDYWPSSSTSSTNLLSGYQTKMETRETRESSVSAGSEARQRGRSRIVGDRTYGGISSRSRSLDRFGEREREERHVSPVGGYDYHTSSSQRQHQMDRPAYMYPTNTTSSGYHSDTNTTSSHDDGSSTQGSTSRGGAGNPLTSFSVPGPPPNYQPAKVKIQAPAYSPLKRNQPAGVARVRHQPLPVVTPRAPDVTYRGVGDGTSPGAANRSFSTEDLNTEMLNLEGLMKDLNAITASELQS